MDKRDIVKILKDLNLEDIVFITTLRNRNYIVSGADNIDTTKINWSISARIQVIKVDKRGPIRLNGFFRIPVTEIGSITRLAA